MKYIIIAIIACVFGYFYGYMEGYVKGYDDAKETYSSFYERLMKIQKETYEKKLNYEKDNKIQRL